MATALEVYGREYTEGDSPSITRKYVITDCADDGDAIDALLAEAASIDGLVRQSVSVEEIEGEEAGGSTYRYRGEIRYGLRNRKDTGESTYSFDTSGGTSRITHAPVVACYDAAGGPQYNADSWGGAINAKSENGEVVVEGVDVKIPTFRFSETHYIAAGSVTEAYKGQLAELTGKTNNATFRGRPAGEVLFCGAQGSERGTDDWEITFHFEVSPNVTGLTIGTITGIDKAGWDLLWVLSHKDKDAAAGTLTAKPQAVFVHRVYNQADFSLLGIG